MFDDPVNTILDKINMKYLKCESTRFFKESIVRSIGWVTLEVIYIQTWMYVGPFLTCILLVCGENNRNIVNY